MYQEEINYLLSFINYIKIKSSISQISMYDFMNILLSKYSLSNLEAAPILDDLESSIGLIVHSDSNFNKLESEIKLYAMRLQTKLEELKKII